MKLTKPGFCKTSELFACDYCQGFSPVKIMTFRACAFAVPSEIEVINHGVNGYFSGMGQTIVIKRAVFVKGNTFVKSDSVVNYESPPVESVPYQVETTRGPEYRIFFQDILPGEYPRGFTSLNPLLFAMSLKTAQQLMLNFIISAPVSLTRE